jgi:hypothetical protein
LKLNFHWNQLNNNPININNANNKTIDNKYSNINQINGTLNTNCSINIQFQIDMFDRDSEMSSVNIYSILVSFIALSEVAVTFWMLKKIGDSRTLSNSVII